MKFGIAKIIFVLLWLGIVCTSCVDEAGEIGNDLISSSDFLNCKDTVFSVTAYSVLDDSLSTAKYSPTLLGSFIDENFGMTDASIITQIVPDISQSYNFPSTAVLDSAVLSLAYTTGTNIYPTDYDPATGDPITIRIYELTEDLDKGSDSLYRSNTSISYDPTIRGALITYPRVNDSVKVGGVNRVPQMRIKLDKNWVTQRFFKDAQASDYATVDDFVKFFKGLYIQASTGTANSCITYLNLISTYTRLTLFYHTGDPSDTVQKTNTFQIDTKEGTYFSQFNHHNYIGATSNLLSQIRGTDVSTGSQQLFLQTMGGVNIRLTMPKIPEWMKDKRVVINQASLIFPVDFPTGSYDPISQINAYIVKSNGVLQLLPDYGTYAYMDGKYNATSQSYRLRITRYFQRIIDPEQFGLTPEDENTLLIIAEGKRTSANSSILKGTGNNNVRIEVIYTYR